MQKGSTSPILLVLSNFAYIINFLLALVNIYLKNLKKYFSKRQFNNLMLLLILDKQSKGLKYIVQSQVFCKRFLLYVIYRYIREE